MPRYTRLFDQSSLEDVVFVGGKTHRLCEEHGRDVDVAVRSSAMAEDLPTASYAGQQESFRGAAVARLPEVRR